MGAEEAHVDGLLAVARASRCPWVKHMLAEADTESEGVAEGGADTEGVAGVEFEERTGDSESIED